MLSKPLTDRRYSKYPQKTSLGIFLSIFFISSLSLASVEVFSTYRKIALGINVFLTCLVILLFWRERKSYIEKEDIYSCVYLLLLAIYAIFTLFFSQGKLVSVARLIFPLFGFIVFSKIKFSNVGKRILMEFGACVIFALFLYSFPYSARWEEYQWVLINPNTLAQFMMFFFMVFCVCADFKKTDNKVKLFLLLIISFWGICNYRSRAAMLAMVCFLALALLFEACRNRYLFIGCTVFVIVLGTLIPIVYMSLYEKGLHVTVWGKPLFSGRQIEWGNMFRLFKEQPMSVLYGLGSDTVLSETGLNTHNNFFNFIVYFGVIGYLAYYVFILFFIWKYSKRLDNAVVRKGLLMYVSAVLILGFFESTAFFAPFYPFTYFGMIIAGSEFTAIERKGTLEK